MEQSLAVHLLSRVAFGPRPGEAERVAAMGAEAYLSEQMEAPTEPELDARLRRYPLARLSTQQSLTRLAADRSFAGQLYRELASVKLIRVTHARNQLEELMVDFWFNHLNVFFRDGFVAAATSSYEREAIRPHVFGRFRDLLGASAQHPAMLFYLDNFLSRADRSDAQTGELVPGLNENYGRELMELHTLGVDSGFSQPDVVDAARALTGWGIDDPRSSGQFVFRARAHDTGGKSIFGLDLPAGGNKDDGDRLLDHLAGHPSTGRFIARRLAQRFVADVPPESVVDRVAGAFSSSGGSIREMLAALFSSIEFWSFTASAGLGKPKTPLEFVASSLRAIGADVQDGAGAVRALSGMGMAPYLNPAPPGYPNAGSAWVNPSSQLLRMNFALDLATGRLSGTRPMTGPLEGTGAEPAGIARAFATQVLGRALSPTTLAAVSRIARTGSVPTAGRALGLLLASPEHQVR